MSAEPAQDVAVHGVAQVAVQFRRAVRGFDADLFHDAAFTGIQVQRSTVRRAAAGDVDPRAAVAAHAAPVVDQHHVDPLPGRLDGGAHAGHAGPDHYQVGMNGFLLKLHTFPSRRV